MLFLAADHAGFKLKEKISQRLRQEGIVFDDLGSFSDASSDYPFFAKLLAKSVLKHRGRGILVCGSGEGMAMVANRFSGIRAAVVWNEEVTKETREHNDSNVISLPARFIDFPEAWKIVTVFLSTGFSHEERHKRRISQIDEKL